MARPDTGGLFYGGGNVATKRIVFIALAVLGIGAGFAGGVFVGANAGSAERAKLKADAAKYQRDLAASRSELNDARTSVGRAQDADRDALNHISASAVGIDSAIGSAGKVKGGIETGASITHSIGSGIEGDIGEVGIALDAVKRARAGLQQLQSGSGSGN